MTVIIDARAQFQKRIKNQRAELRRLNRSLQSVPPLNERVTYWQKSQEATAQALHYERQLALAYWWRGWYLLAIGFILGFFLGVRFLG